MCCVVENFEAYEPGSTFNVTGEPSGCINACTFPCWRVSVWSDGSGTSITRIRNSTWVCVCVIRQISWQYRFRAWKRFEPSVSKHSRAAASTVYHNGVSSLFLCSITALTAHKGRLHWKCSCFYPHEHSLTNMTSKDTPQHTNKHTAMQPTRPKWLARLADSPCIFLFLCCVLSANETVSVSEWMGECVWV